MRHVINRLYLTLALVMFAVAYTAETSAAENGRAAAMERLAGSMLQDIHQTTWISEGKSKHIIYIFFDPNCPFCHRLYVSTRNWVKENKMELRWIPVGILTTTSAGKAASILGAKDPLKAFYKNEDNYVRAQGQGGGVEEDIPSPAVEKKLKANEALLARTGFGAVPIMLFRGNDNTPILIQGSPPANKLEIIRKYVK